MCLLKSATEPYKDPGTRRTLPRHLVEARRTPQPHPGELSGQSCRNNMSGTTSLLFRYVAKYPEIGNIVTRAGFFCMFPRDLTPMQETREIMGPAQAWVAVAGGGEAQSPMLSPSRGCVRARAPRPRLPQSDTSLAQSLNWITSWPQLLFRQFAITNSKWTSNTPFMNT